MYLFTSRPATPYTASKVLESQNNDTRVYEDEKKPVVEILPGFISRITTSLVEAIWVSTWELCGVNICATTGTTVGQSKVHKAITEVSSHG